MQSTATLTLVQVRSKQRPQRVLSCHTRNRFMLIKLAEMQNRHQKVCRTVARKVFNRGAWQLCGGAWHYKKIPLIYSVSRFNLGGLELCLGGLSPPNPPPWRRDGRDERTVIFCDPVLIFKNKSKSKHSPKIFSNLKSKPKTFGKCNLFTTKIPHFFSVN